MMAPKSSRSSRTVAKADENLQKQAASNVHGQTTKRADGMRVPTFSRSKLVGKFPEIKHQPAPMATHYQLSEDVRDQLVSRMLLT
jgi:hypothetical protein